MTAVASSSTATTSTTAGSAKATSGTGASTAVGTLLLDPRPPLPTEGTQLAPRLTTLDGAVIALVHNGKTHGRELMEYVVDELRRHWSIAEVIHLGPPSPGYGGHPDEAKPVAEEAMAAISAIGD